MPSLRTVLSETSNNNPYGSSSIPLTLTGSLFRRQQAQGHGQGFLFLFAQAIPGATILDRFNEDTGFIPGVEAGKDKAVPFMGQKGQSETQVTACIREGIKANQAHTAETTFKAYPEVGHPFLQLVQDLPDFSQVVKTLQHFGQVLAFAGFCQPADTPVQATYFAMVMQKPENQYDLEGKQPCQDGRIIGRQESI
ncbi:dienelactone hydrolase and related enzymes [Moorella thermoacetica Y72]|uniref:Dienelactone hydrolase and related enzymes n=1 Tax=Moorella thermoacetica Y72 TaxID=1325331 RepID=A0A0S6UDB3_NEOTH|nr:dienelactone hydrolase and related enzymes [Moorella thermoacetica Y72]